MTFQNNVRLLSQPKADSLQVGCLPRIMFKRAAFTLAAGLMAASAATSAHAQQREIINPSFESVGAIPGLGDGFEITEDTNVPGWLSTNGEIEVWVEGFQNRSAQEGSHLVELNPTVPIGLYQEICLINGEDLSWEFYHAARTAGRPVQTVVYEVVSLDGGTTHQGLDTNTVTSVGSNNDQSNNDWDQVNGTTVYTGPTGLQRLQFRSTSGGSNGNFLDDIQIQLTPIVAFESLTTSEFEGATGELPQFAIDGVVPAAFEIQFSITGGTATQGTDYTVNSNTISIPAGTYDGTSAGSIFVVPITVLTDALTEGDETIEITFGQTFPSTAAIISGPNCTATQTVALHTIIDLPLIETGVESFAPITDSAGGVTGSVLDSDTINGVPVTLADVTLTVGASSPQLSLDPATGLITVAPNTPSGTYTVEYTICEDGNLNNCSTVTETVIVQIPQPSLTIAKTADSTGPFTVGDVVTYTYTVTNDGDQIIDDIAITDTHNGSDPAPVPGDETLLTDNGPIGDSTDLAVDGAWDSLGPGDVVTFTGTYTITQTDAENL